MCSVLCASHAWGSQVWITPEVRQLPSGWEQFCLRGCLGLACLSTVAECLLTVRESVPRVLSMPDLTAHVLQDSFACRFQLAHMITCLGLMEIRVGCAALTELHRVGMLGKEAKSLRCMSPCPHKIFQVEKGCIWEFLVLMIISVISVYDEGLLHAPQNN